MKRFILTKYVTDKDINQIKKRLIKLLLKWQNKELSDYDIGDIAGEMLFSKKWPEYDMNDPRAVPLRILQILDSWDINELSRKDVPRLMRFLNSPPHLIEKEGEELHNYLISHHRNSNET